MLIVENVEGNGTCREERTLIPHREVVFISKMATSRPLPTFTSFPQSLPFTIRDPTPAASSQIGKEREETGAHRLDALPFATEPSLHGTDPTSKAQKLDGASHGL